VLVDIYVNRDNGILSEAMWGRSDILAAWIESGYHIKTGLSFLHIYQGKHQPQLLGDQILHITFIST